ncbi:MAG: 50S ribosomal protein L30 [Candidatus Altiarchaeota archaeon]
MTVGDKGKGVVAVLRVRGSVHLRKSIGDTLNLMNLNKINHCVITNAGVIKPMLTIVNDYVTWGEVTEKTLADLIRKRGRVIGDKPVDDEYVKKNSDYDSIASLSKAILEGSAKLRDVKGLKPVFRLTPPLKGFERGGIKKNVKIGGALGYRGEEMNKLIERMI